MFKRIALFAVVAISAMALTATASAQRPADPGKGGRCIAAGVGTLVSLGLIADAAQGKVDYAPLGSQPGGAGFIRVAFTEPAFLPLSTVIGLHRTNPELFVWCDTV
jgi:NO-binding membrane sensor protein with MHYT domain